MNIAIISGIIIMVFFIVSVTTILLLDKSEEYRNLKQIGLTKVGNDWYDYPQDEQVPDCEDEECVYDGEREYSNSHYLKLGRRNTSVSGNDRDQ